LVAFGVFAASISAVAAQSMSMGSGGGGMMMIGEMDTSQVPRVPPVAGYAEGVQIFFIHTEVSDPEIGRIMTGMMGSPVPVVPSLAEAGEGLLARVWAFSNGVQPKGPRGPLDFQPDVFDHPVGSDGYRPLRMLYLATWADGAASRLLTSAADVEAAIAAGELTEERTGVVVNAPFLTWPGGQR
jgi:hypothetical protein